VADWKLNGRAADVFSLGCVLLEVLVMHDRGTLEHIRRNRSPDPSFHANLDRVETWLQPYNRVLSPRRYHLQYEIKAMLSRDPAKRPTVQDLLIKITACDLGRVSPSTPSIFSNCCQRLYIPRQEHEMQTLQLKNRVTHLETTLCEDRARMQAEHEEQTWALKKNIDDLKQDLRHVADALRTTSIAFQWNDEDMQAREVSPAMRIK
jgi:serine/threonine protein kinase